jgi:biopolymer transport protein ExbD
MALKSRLVKEVLEEEYNYELPVSCIDVVFQLLLFFLAASKFKMPENKLDVELPKDAGINPMPTKVIPPREYRVKVDGTGPGPIYTLDTTPVSGIEELVVKLKSAAASSPQLSVVIVGKPKTPFGYIVWALDACKQAQIDDIKFEGFAVPGLGQPTESASGT